MLLANDAAKEGGGSSGYRATRIPGRNEVEVGGPSRGPPLLQPADLLLSSTPVLRILLLFMPLEDDVSLGTVLSMTSLSLVAGDGVVGGLSGNF